MRLKGKHALVTGGGAGNGRAIGLGFAREGAAVCVADVDAAAAERVAGEIRATGIPALGIAMDVSDPSAVERGVEQAWKVVGPLDVLVNNAGILIQEPFLEMPIEHWRRMLAVNLDGALHCTAAVARRMRDRGGSIINLSSIGATIAFPNSVGYCVSKADVAMLTRTTALELAPHRIRVNALAPGIVRTAMTRPALEDTARHARTLDRIPLGRIGEPADLVGAAVFLASDEAAWVTGTSIVIDGGRLLH